jgi:carboxymethylenebutenolidase
VELRTEWIEYPSGGEPVRAYRARPSRVDRPLPGLVVIQEIWGVDDHIQDMVHRFATAGYVAMAPDLYAHAGPRPAALAPERIDAVKAFLDTLPHGSWWDPQRRREALAGLPEPERRQVGETLDLLLAPDRPMVRYLADVQAAAAHLREDPACGGRAVGAVGYCMGGALAGLLACADPRLGAAVIYYGAAPPADRIGGIRCPVLGLYGGDDPRITDGVPAFAQAMREAGKAFTYHVYPGAPHAFFNDTRRSFDVEASRDAWARTLSFLAQHLGAAG